MLALSVAGAVLVLWTWLSLPDVSGLKTRNPETTSLMRLRAAQAKKTGKKISLHQEWAAFNRFLICSKNLSSSARTLLFIRTKGSIMRS